MPDGQKLGSRMKTYEELDDKQKIAHLKGNIGELSSAVVSLDRMVSRLLAHSHVGGKVVTPLVNPNYEPSASVIHLSYELRNEGKRLI